VHTNHTKLTEWIRNYARSETDIVSGSPRTDRHKDTQFNGFLCDAKKTHRNVKLHAGCGGLGEAYLDIHTCMHACMHMSVDEYISGIESKSNRHPVLSNIV